MLLDLLAEHLQTTPKNEPEVAGVAIMLVGVSMITVGYTIFKCLEVA